MVPSHEKRYAIQSNDEYGFCTGLIAGDEQVLMGLLCPNLAAFHFSREGDLLRRSQRPLPFFQAVAPPYDIDDKRISPLIETWQKEMELRPATIVVKKFFLREPFTGIEDYPVHFHEVLSDATSSAEEIANFRASMEAWRKEGKFVLHWGNDCWMDASGKVESS